MTGRGKCGVVWCDVVGWGGVWCGVVGCDVVWYGVVWCGVVRCGVVWWGGVGCEYPCKMRAGGVRWSGVGCCGVRRVSVASISHTHTNRTSVPQRLV